jgi:ribose transport system permease protein
MGAVAGVIAGLFVGGIVGLINALLTTRVGIPSFLTTLAMMGIARGTAMWMTQTKSVPILDDNFIWLLGGGNLGPISVLVIWTLIIAIIGHIVLRRTTFGRRVLATGGSETAARYSGIDTRGIKMRVLIISSLGAAIAGMLYAGRLHSGRFQLGEGDELSLIAAAVPGGTNLIRGRRICGRLHCRIADDRRHQQRAPADGPRIQPAADRTGNDHHRRRRH